MFKKLLGKLAGTDNQVDEILEASLKRMNEIMETWGEPSFPTLDGMAFGIHSVIDELKAKELIDQKAYDRFSEKVKQWRESKNHVNSASGKSTG
jgi:hypothetical protein